MKNKKTSQLTINGYTEEFENEILKELKKTKKLVVEGKIKVYKTEEEIREHLAKEYGYKAKQ